MRTGHGEVRTEVIKSSPGKCGKLPQDAEEKEKRDKNDETDNDKCGGQYMFGHHAHRRGS